ncbi:MAG TPA: glycosyltransferase [Anaerolineae bacterium]|nr:glycosyltransferase [Anaerolineae bacterium]
MPSRRIKVLFFLPSLLTGGAERVTLNLIRALDRERFEPSLVLLRHEGHLLEDLPSDVRIYPLRVRRMRYACFPLACLVRRVRPDVVYSVMDHTNLSAIMAAKLSALWGHRCAVVGSVHSTFSRVLMPKWASLLMKFLIPTFYPMTHRVIVVSQGSKQDMLDQFPKLKDRLVVIYNPAFDEELFHLAREPVDHEWFLDKHIPVVVGCGRLVPSKGFRYLLEAVAITTQDIACRVVLIGDGPERGHLNLLARQLGIDDRVAFLGHVRNPFRYLARADLVVHTSLHEGLPTVLIEAMACGAPVIATDCPSGPAEIVTDGVNGRLISPPGDAHVLARAIVQLLGDRDLAARLARRSKERAKAFHVSRIVQEYERVLEEAAWAVSKNR